MPFAFGLDFGVYYVSHCIDIPKFSSAAPASLNEHSGTTVWNGYCRVSAYFMWSNTDTSHMVK